MKDSTLREGISDEFLTAAGVRVLPADSPRKFEIPYRDWQGKLTGHFRWRLRHPLPDQKYGQDPDSGYHAYFNHLPLRPDPELYLTEGEFKALSLAEAGFQVIGLPGLHCYTHPDPEVPPVLLPGIVDTVGVSSCEVVYFIGDSDTLTNLEFYRSATVLANGISVPVFTIQLPLGGPKGIDDLRDSCNGEFPVQFAEMRRGAMVIPQRVNFLLIAKNCLATYGDSIHQLADPLERDRHVERLVKMAASARLSGQTELVIEQFCTQAQRTSKLTQAAFNRSVDGEIKRRKADASEDIAAAEERDELLRYFNSIKPWPAMVPISEMLWLTHEKLEKYVWTKPVYRIIATAWIPVTYVFQASPFLPMLIFTSPQEESGKTAFMTTMVWMCYRPVASSLISSAGAHRWLEQYQGTIWSDEVKSIEDNPGMTALWNLGFNNSGHPVDTPVVRRYDAETKQNLNFKVSYMKMLAGIGSFLSPDTISRSLVVPMIRALPHEMDQIEDYVFITEEEMDSIRRMWTRWRADYLGTFRKDVLRTIRMMPKDIRGRNKQKFSSLFTVCRLAADGWYEMIEKAAREMMTVVPAGTGTRLDRTLLRDMYFIGKHQLDLKRRGLPTVIALGRAAKRDFISADEWVKALRKLPESPWMSWNKSRKILDVKDMYYLLRPRGLDKPERFKEHMLNWAGFYLETIFKAFEPYKEPGDVSPFDDGEEPPPSPPPSSPSPEDPPKPGNEAFQKEEGEKSENCHSSHSESSEPVDPEGVNEEWQGQKIASKKGSATPHQTVEAEEDMTIRSGWSGKIDNFVPLIPPSTPQANFCIPTHPERFVGVDTETFYPWPEEGEITAQERRRRKDGKAHKWAKDPRRNVLRLVSISSETETRVFDLLQETIPDEVRDLLRNSTLIVHNADFDLTVLRRHGFELSSQVYDTLLAAKLLSLGEVEPKYRRVKDEDEMSQEEFDEEEEAYFDQAFVEVSNDLASVVERYLGIKMAKKESKLGGSDWSLKDLTPAQIEYARADVVHFHPLVLKLTEELKTHGQWANFLERSEFQIHLNNVKFAGIPTDKPMLLKDKAECEAIVLETRKSLLEMFKDFRPQIPKSRRKKKDKKATSPAEGVAVVDSFRDTEEMNPGYHVHIKAALAAHGIEVPDTKKNTLSAIDTPETRAFCRHAEQTKLLTIIKGIEASIFPDGRVRSAQWNQLVARSGRIIPREPNVQQMPRKWRKPFRVEEPYFWLKMDLSQIEIYILAIHCHCPHLIELLQSGKDIYVMIAAEIFGKDPVRGDGENQVSDTLRDTTKTLVLGISYCLGQRSFINRVEIATRPSFGVQGVIYTPDEAREFYAKFFDLFPEVKYYQDRSLQEALEVKFVYTATGQRRFLPPLKNDIDEVTGYWKSRVYRQHILVNTPIQGSAACHYIRSINKLVPRLPAQVELVHLIHDEVGLLVTAKTAKATILAVIQSFQEAFAEIFGNELTPKLDYQLSDSWAKLPKH
jgi:DNA polymerase I